MTIYIAFGGVIVFLFLYRLISAKPRAVAKSIGQKMNIRPSLIENMIVAMGAERGRLFVEHMTPRGQDFDPIAAYTFVIYQIMKNDHPSNIKYWKTRLETSGIDPSIETRSAASAFMYLRNAGADPMQVPNFVNVYNTIE